MELNVIAIMVALNLYATIATWLIMRDQRKRSARFASGKRVISQVQDKRSKINPFPKPSGKLTPKVHDDSAAWRKEHEND